MKTYKITLNGCDDSTKVEMVLTAEQLSVLRGLEFLVRKAANANCKPSMDIEEKSR